jgi:cellulose synthase operon protein YhjU
MMDHNGLFGDFLKEVRDFGGMKAPLMNQADLPVNLLSFDGSPVYNDTAVLNRWLEQEGRDNTKSSATFFNMLPLHDGNHFPGNSKPADYKLRAQKLFDELDAFLTQIEKENRRVMVVIVPEHGAALQGDRMQVSGLRDIPSPAITHVPVGVKFVGMKAPHQGSAIEIDQPSSFLAISELVARSVDGKNFVADRVDWDALTKNLPQTAPVSENANAVVIQYQGKPYVRLSGGDWVPYPQ